MFVNIAGALSPKLQQSLSVEVTRSSSAHAPRSMLGGVKEWTFRSRDTLKDGPQVDIVDIGLPFVFVVFVVVVKKSRAKAVPPFISMMMGWTRVLGTGDNCRTAYHSHS